MKQVYLKIIGRVQGIFFRAEAEEKARLLGLAGWVRNTSDGAVEILAQGEEAPLNKFIEWCHKGPERAGVENVIVEPQELKEKFENFSIH